MRGMVSLVCFCVSLGAPATASAVTIFDFDWTSSAFFSTLIRVDRVEPDGSITVFDEIRRSGTLDGSGTLVLTPPDAGFDGYVFEFSGVDGGGAGQTLPDGTILAGTFAFPLPPDVPVDLGSSSLFAGFLELQGDPLEPATLSISYVQGSSPHCLFDCSSVEFVGFGRARSGRVAAPEPAGALVAMLGLLAAAWLRRRRVPAF